MAFTLTRTGPNIFTASVGNSFTIDATVDKGMVVIQSITYDGTTKQAAPFTFPVGAGSKNVGIVYAATDPTATVSIVEVDGANTQVLTQQPGSGNTAVLIVN